MKLILISDVAELGEKGAVVEVADGYARNYLFPRSLAVKATPTAIAKAEKVRQERVALERKELEKAQKMAANLTGNRVVLSARSGDDGKLFGSVTAADIVAGVKTFTGVELNRKMVRIAQPIRAIGLHSVQVQIHPEVVFELTLDVVPLAEV